MDPAQVYHLVNLKWKAWQMHPDQQYDNEELKEAREEYFPPEVKRQVAYMTIKSDGVGQVVVITKEGPIKKQGNIRSNAVAIINEKGLDVISINETMIPRKEHPVKELVIWYYA